MDASDVNDAATRLAELVDAAVRGDEVLIARGGVPVVRLVPVHHPARRAPGAWVHGAKVIDPDWWKPDDELADLFGIGPVQKGPDVPSAG